MRTILETDKDFICDIKAPCFQNLSPEEAELVRASKTQVLFCKCDNLTKQGASASYVLFIINGLAKQDGLFGFSIIKRYCEQNINLLNTVRNLMYKQMNGRLAEALLYINSLKNETDEIFQLLSRKDLADFAGISTESTVKLLKTFEKEGLIELHEKDIKLVNHDAMVEISRKG